MIVRIRKLVNSELKNYWFAWTIAIVVFFLFWLVIDESRGIFTSPKELEYTAAGQYYSDVPIAHMTNNTTVTQTFVSERDTFSRIQIPFHIMSSKPHGSIDLTLKINGSKKIAYADTIKLTDLNDGELTNFDFPKIRQAKGKTFELTLKANGLDNGHSVSVWKSNLDHYKQGQLLINGHVVAGDLRFAILDLKKTKLVSTPVFILSGVVFLLLFAVSLLALRKCKDQVHKAFLVTALPIGLILAIAVSPFDQLDELDHYLRSFEVSEGMFVNQVTQHGLGNYIPQSLADTVHQVQFINGNGYEYGIVSEALGNKLNPANRVFMRNYASSYPPTIYIPQAIGLWLGRLLFGSPLMMMFLGRIFNFLAYVFIVYWALKIVPVKKNLFYLIGLLPMSINQAASLSGDSTLIASALLFTAYILYLAYGKVEQINLKHVLTAIGIGIFVGVSKDVYIPMALLFLLIPVRKFKGKKDFIKKVLFVIAGFTIPYIIWNFLNIANLSIPDLRNHSGVSPKGQIKFILSQPFHYLKIFVDSVISLGEYKFLGMLGRLVTIYHFRTPDIVIYTYLFLLLLFGLMNDENDLQSYNLRKFDKFIMVFIMVTVVVLTYTALYVGYTTVGHSVIWGVQGRYFVPVAIFLFLSISNKQMIMKNKNIQFLIYTIIHCCMYVFLYTYLIQINQ